MERPEDSPAWGGAPSVLLGILARARTEGRTASIRYGWGDEIAGYSLFNGAGLSAAPFRTGTVSPRQ